MLGCKIREGEVGDPGGGGGGSLGGGEGVGDLWGGFGLKLF